MARTAKYWARRRSKQGRRAFGKAVSAFQKPSVGSIAKAAWSGVKYLRTLVNSEMQKLDIGPTSASISSTPTVIHITAIPQDDSVSGRTGNSILLSYVFIRGFLAVNASATSTLMRVLLVQDTQQIGDTTPGYTDVLNSSSTVANMNLSTVGRFQILMDKNFWLDTGNFKTYKIQKYFKINQHVRYNGTASTDIQKNGIYLMLCSSEPTNTPTFTYSVRIGWHDN